MLPVNDMHVCDSIIVEYCKVYRTLYYFVCRNNGLWLQFAPPVKCQPERIRVGPLQIAAGWEAPP